MRALHLGRWAPRPLEFQKDTDNAAWIARRGPSPPLPKTPRHRARGPAPPGAPGGPRPARPARPGSARGTRTRPAGARGSAGDRKFPALCSTRSIASHRNMHATLCQNVSYTFHGVKKCLMQARARTSRQESNRNLPWKCQSSVGLQRRHERSPRTVGRSVTVGSGLASESFESPNPTPAPSSASSGGSAKRTWRRPRSWRTGGGVTWKSTESGNQ